MNKYHAKSPCCLAGVIRFGGKRRQCSKCGKTWRVRKCKTGRKCKRVSGSLVLHYLHHEMPSLYAKARMQGVSDDLLRNHLSKSLTTFTNQTEWPVLPRQKPLIVLADAMVQYLEHSWYTFYFIFIKKPQDNQAWIVQPYIKKGTETASGWQNAFKQLPPKTKEAIVAIVCDGHYGLTSMANREGWIIQRCHFHLIARLQSRRSKWNLSRHYEEGIMLYGLVSRVLNESSIVDIEPALEQLKTIKDNTQTKELKTILGGFIKNYQDYRSYLVYPNLNLPKTNNACESLIGSIRGLLHRARGFRTLPSLIKWIIVLLKDKQKITCNGFYQPS